MRLPATTISSLAVSRGQALSFASFAVALATLPPVPSAAAASADVETTLYLATLYQLKGEVADADAALFAGLLAGQSSVPSEDGRIAFLKTSKMLKEYRPTEIGQDAAAAGLKAKVLSRAASREAEGHAKEVSERLFGLLENDRENGMKRDQLNRVKQEMAPEQLRFVHSSFVVAQAEIDATIACFGEAERAEALRLAIRAFSKGSSAAEDPTPPPQYAVARSVGPQDAVLLAINTMPSSAGLALTRGDLQETLNNAYREGLAASPGAQSVAAGDVPIVRSRPKE